MWWSTIRVVIEWKHAWCPGEPESLSSGAQDMVALGDRLQLLPEAWWGDQRQIRCEQSGSDLIGTVSAGWRMCRERVRCLCDD